MSDNSKNNTLVKYLKVSLFLVVLFVGSKANAQSHLTANQVIEKIRKNVTIPWMQETRDVIIYGKGETEVKGIAVTFMSTLAVLQKAKEAGCNFVITHEPTFYSHYDDLKIHNGDPVQEAKIKFIEENNMVIFRFHDHQHRTFPDQIYEGVVEKMGWKQYWKVGSKSFEMPETTLGKFVADLQKHSGGKTIRIVGDPKMKVKKVGLALGAAGTDTHFKVLKETNCDVLIVGESNEWETAPYFQDAQTLGQNKALVVMGHADSEEAGMVYFKSWLQKFYPNTKIEFIEAGNPFWAGK
ncbi:Nif3-like dinuclear metal center hexameric protein [Lacihabitans sp. LS3-19]|uniref:Nif3-like dinuclear metal center hexameric protein n=1 Tax=Lacihabitans sp. LS3-19 TaxID=2487335 RepID=UPI0020CB7971|nr:Nif3-like dinuclear metal center hexameric protein [Lacihabitans sp. LS3-19]